MVQGRRNGSGQIPKRGQGPGRGQGSAKGMGRGGGKASGQGLGATGICACPKCGFEKSHRRGVPCMEERCPNCGSVLLRKGGTHYRRATKNKE